MSRIDLNDNGQDVLFKMCDGNPGGLQALMELLKHGESIDPQGFMGGMGAVLLLDTLGVYGSDIYILWNDQCGRDVRELMMLLRANQLGFIGSEKIKAIASDQMGKDLLTKEEMLELDVKVCDRLEGFMKRDVVVTQ